MRNSCQLLDSRRSLKTRSLSTGLADELRSVSSGAKTLIAPRSSFSIALGLHHLCFRAKSRQDVEIAAAKLKEIGAEIVRGPQEGDWAPGYYYVLFEDPDKIRLEICFVPGSGLLAKEHSFKAGDDYEITPGTTVS